MGKYQYKFTIEQIDNKKSLNFETSSHEDIFKIVQIMNEKMDLDESESTSLAVGLKLFSGVLLEHKDSEPFKQLMPHFKKFMKMIKNQNKGDLI